MNTMPAIQNLSVKIQPRLVRSKTKPQGFLVKTKKMFQDFFNRRASQDLDYETWRNIEFRNERELGKRPPIDLGRWF